MAKIKMTIENGITFEEGCEEYILDCKSRNLRDGTIRHYRDTMVQMKKYIGSDTLVKDMTVETFNDFVVDLPTIKLYKTHKTLGFKDAMLEESCD